MIKSGQLTYPLPQNLSFPYNECRKFFLYTETYTTLLSTAFSVLCRRTLEPTLATYLQHYTTCICKPLPSPFPSAFQPATGNYYTLNFYQIKNIHTVLIVRSNLKLPMQGNVIELSEFSGDQMCYKYDYCDRLHTTLVKLEHKTMCALWLKLCKRCRQLPQEQKKNYEEIGVIDILGQYYICEDNLFADTKMFLKCM